MDQPYLSEARPGPASPSDFSPAPSASVRAPAQPGLVPRSAERTKLSQDSPARLVLPNRRSVFVTLHDISRHGCCVMRNGDLGVQPGDQVVVEFWRDSIETKDSLKATVRWVRAFDGRTRAGMQFSDSSIKAHRAIDSYLQRSAAAGG